MISAASIERETYADADCDGFNDNVPQSPELWGNLGDDGRDESVSSSMSECEEGGLVDFFFPKACLNELLSWRKEKERKITSLASLDLCSFYFEELVCRCHPSHCLRSVYRSRVLTYATQYL